MMRPQVRKPTGRVPRIKIRETVETPEDSLLERIEEELSGDGITLSGNENVVDEYLILPRDITDIPIQELGKYLNAHTQQKMWSRTLIGRVTVMAKEKARELDKIRDRVFATLPAKMAVKEKELKLANNEECREIVEKLDFYQQKLMLLSDYLENLVDAIFNISREITRRSSDWNDEKNGHNTDNGRRFGRGR